MNEHIPEALLESFVEGVLGDDAAVDVALHLDACPSCAARAAGLEPLALAFAVTPDPVVPSGLVAAALAAASEPAPVAVRVAPNAEIAIGGGMLTAAATMLALLGDPLALASQVGLWAGATNALGRALLLGLPTPALALPLTVLVGASGTMMLVRSAWSAAPQRDAA
jgi:hypothetical protein